MQKLRVKFTKEGGARYISHLDLMRTMERALRRAKINLAFSEGFNPHPKISFASALSLGVESQAEYMDVELAKSVNLGEVKEQLNNSLPGGIKVLEVEEIKGKGGAAMSLVEAASYQVKGKTSQVWPQERWFQVIRDLQQQEEIQIQREGKKGVREVDIAPLLLKIELLGLEQENFHLGLLVRSGSRGNVRAEEVLQALQKYYSLPLIQEEVSIMRTGLYQEQENRLLPLISLENEVVILKELR